MFWEGLPRSWGVGCVWREDCLRGVLWRIAEDVFVFLSFLQSGANHGHEEVPYADYDGQQVEPLPLFPLLSGLRSLGQRTYGH